MRYRIPVAHFFFLGLGGGTGFKLHLPVYAARTI
jgi:hypothetical protein